MRCAATAYAGHARAIVKHHSPTVFAPQRMASTPRGTGATNNVFRTTNKALWVGGDFATVANPHSVRDAGSGSSPTDLREAYVATPYRPPPSYFNTSPRASMTMPLPTRPPTTRKSGTRAQTSGTHTGTATRAEGPPRAATALVSRRAQAHAVLHLQAGASPAMGQDVPVTPVRMAVPLSPPRVTTPQPRLSRGPTDANSGSGAAAHHAVGQRDWAGDANPSSPSQPAAIVVATTEEEATVGILRLRAHLRRVGSGRGNAFMSSSSRHGSPSSGVGATAAAGKSPSSGISHGARRPKPNARVAAASGTGDGSVRHATTAPQSDIGAPARPVLKPASMVEGYPPVTVAEQRKLLEQASFKTTVQVQAAEQRRTRAQTARQAGSRSHARGGTRRNNSAAHGGHKPSLRGRAAIEAAASKLDSALQAVAAEVPTRPATDLHPHHATDSGRAPHPSLTLPLSRDTLASAFSHSTSAHASASAAASASSTPLARDGTRPRYRAPTAPTTRRRRFIRPRPQPSTGGRRTAPASGPAKAPATTRAATSTTRGGAAAAAAVDATLSSAGGAGAFPASPPHRTGTRARLRTASMRSRQATPASGSPRPLVSTSPVRVPLASNQQQYHHHHQQLSSQSPRESQSRDGALASSPSAGVKRPGLRSTVAHLVGEKEPICFQHAPLPFPTGSVLHFQTRTALVRSSHDLCLPSPGLVTFGLITCFVYAASCCWILVQISEVGGLELETPIRSRTDFTRVPLRLTQQIDSLTLAASSRYRSLHTHALARAVRGLGAGADASAAAATVKSTVDPLGVGDAQFDLLGGLEVAEGLTDAEVAGSRASTKCSNMISKLQTRRIRHATLKPLASLGFG